ncbi:hypothetical protein LV75_006409 [Actinokineospora diospyrosa]|uniref:Uncharacterized protein n=1 Tax=Actinokineospora diospyrosa TaxID=103728 RepID=A0ABT1IMI4_9PSEU|nr:hypothetical protein [Actinokineospora diospyrosa]
MPAITRAGMGGQLRLKIDVNRPRDMPVRVRRTTIRLPQPPPDVKDAELSHPPIQLSYTNSDAHPQNARAE